MEAFDSFHESVLACLDVKGLQELLSQAHPACAMVNNDDPNAVLYSYAVATFR